MHPTPSPAQIIVNAKHDTACRGDFQHLEAPDLLWTGAIFADHSQKECRDHPIDRQDLLLEDLILLGLYDSDTANSFLQCSQHYTATCVLALYDHVKDLKHDTGGEDL